MVKIKFFLLIDFVKNVYKPILLASLICLSNSSISTSLFKVLLSHSLADLTILSASLLMFASFKMVVASFSMLILTLTKKHHYYNIGMGIVFKGTVKQPIILRGTCLIHILNLCLVNNV